MINAWKKRSTIISITQVVCEWDVIYKMWDLISLILNMSIRLRGTYKHVCILFSSIVDHIKQTCMYYKW